MLKKTTKLVILSLLIWPALTFAKMDTKVKWSGEYRLRGLMQDNLDVSNSSIVDVYNHRLILKGEMAPNDTIEAHFSVNLNQTLGGENRRGFAGVSLPESERESIQILTAYADWNLGSSFLFKFGRMEINWANEAIFSKNDDDEKPYSFDGGVWGYDSKGFSINLGALKISDWDKDFGPSNSIDPDESGYFISLDLKSFGKLLETMQVFFLRIQSSNYTNTNLGLDVEGSSLNRIGASLAGSKKSFFYQADYAGLQGSYNGGDSASAWMAHVNLGFKFGEESPGTLYLIGHYDSGDDAGTAGSDESYRPAYYNHHKYGGLMDLLAWGNLKYFGLGASLVHRGKHDFSLQALRFSLSDASKGPNSISYLGYGETNDFISEAVSKNTNGQSATALGTEIDLVYKREFQSDAYIEVLAGMFLVDEYFESYGREDNIYSIRISTGFKF